MKISPIEAISQPVPTNLKVLVQRVHKAKGRHHMQIAMCDLFDACALPNVRPGAEMVQTLPPVSELEQQNQQLREQIASKMDAAQLLDFLDISMDDLVILLEDYLVERKEELILALED